ncbi:lysozyme inhibitor LprI family protein [Fictibacillus aquaticus]|uniref:Lysozyme inhibitor LprI-like N-terminal domain-containing protein n=1 Tax=Fictibacillus aquaticus TaxID=2021314 RepID=A0A235F9J7_9BACL|nr:lysozyme inhibitor LprI family protein [Fictibacillus aquaticus]OYD57693.1 hypothetical protein CGZ90_13600 [Fictibacillus aquaticus]
MHHRIGFMLIMSLFLLTACGEKEQTAKTKETVKTEEVSVEKLEQDEVSDILRTNLESVKTIFTKAGEENGWGTQNPADFSMMRSDLLPYATEGFTDNDLKKMAEEYYCECDQSFMPHISYTVGLTFEQKKEDVLDITALEPATEINNTGSLWKFTLTKEDDTWKLDRWSASTIENQDLKLTKEDAVKLFSEDGTEAEFVREYDSAEAGAKAYVIKVMSSMEGNEYEYTMGVSSKDTMIVHDFEQEEEAAEAPEASEATEPSTPAEEETVSITSNSKSENLNKLDLIAAQEWQRMYESDYQLLEDAGHNYQLWDKALNEIYSILKDNMADSEFQVLKTEQIQWIKTRDEVAQTEFDREGGGSLSRVVQVESLADSTKERCYELVNLYMK